MTNYYCLNRIPLPTDTKVECHVCGNIVDVTDALPLDENDRSGGWICDRCGLLEADRVWEKYDNEIEAGLDRDKFSQEQINRLGDIGERLDNWNTGVFNAAAAKFNDGPHQSRYREALEDAARQADYEDQQAMETELRNA